MATDSYLPFLVVPNPPSRVTKNISPERVNTAVNNSFEANTARNKAMIPAKLYSKLSGDTK